MKLSLVVISLFISLTAQAKLRIAQYNIRNFDYDERANIPTNKDFLYDTIKSMDPDFMAVEEIREVQTFTDFIAKRFNGKYQVALTKCGGAHGQRLGFVYNVNKFKLIKLEEDLRTSNPQHQTQPLCYDGSRPLAVGTFLKLDSNEIVLAVAAHLKSGGQSSSIKKRFAQLEIISSIIKEKRKIGIKNFMVMGDLNSTEYMFKGKEYKQFLKIVTDMNLIDLARDIKCSAYWWGGIDDNKQYPSLLDHLMVSQELKDSEELTKAKALGHCEALKCNATSESSMGTSFDEVSDHCPVLAE